MGTPYWRDVWSLVRVKFNYSFLFARRIYFSVDNSNSVKLDREVVGIIRIAEIDSYEIVGFL